MSATEEQLNKAGEAFYEAIAAHMGTGREVHGGTVVAAAGRMAGAFLFRSFGFDLKNTKPGTAVLSENANEEGPKYMDQLGRALAAQGIGLDPTKFNGTTPAEHAPRVSYAETFTRLSGPFWEIKEKQGLELHDCASACMRAAAGLIQQCANVLDPNVAFGIVVMGVIEGSKTMPPFILGTAAPKPWYKLW